MPLPVHMNAVAALSDVFDMQRLVDVSNKMNDKLSGLVPPPRPQFRIQKLRSVVLKRADNAAISFTIPNEVDAAIRRRVIFGVDKVEVLAEATPFGVPDAVGPRRNTGEVVLRVVAQQLLEIGRRALLDEVARDIRDRDMTQTYTPP